MEVHNMNTQTQRLGNRILPSLLILLLSGCASTQHTSEPSVHDSDTMVAATADVIEDYSSVIVARENAIDQSGELLLLEESLAAATAAELADSDNNLVEDSSVTITDEVIAASPEETRGIESEAPAPVDIWQRVRSGFQLQDTDHPRVKSDLKWFAKHQSYLDRTFNRADPYFYHIVEQIEARGMPMELALLPVVESAFQPFAYSHGRAAGIWQFIPGTARRFGLKIDWWYDGRRDIKASTTAALDYLQTLHKRFDGDWLLALAAYNSGGGTVSKAIRKNKKRGKGTTFWDLKLPRETQGYVPKLLAIASLVANPEQYGVSLKSIANQPHLAEVNIGSQLDLAIAADMADLTLEQLYILNPAYNRWATSPDGPHLLLLPVEKADSFKEKLAQLPKQQRVKWVRHRIKEGQTLGHIAIQYKTTVKTIKTANKIRGNNIRAGRYLIIPAASKSLNNYALSEQQRLQSKQNSHRSGNKTQHIVRKGDTFWDIAVAHKVSVRKLASWNGMAPRDTLRPGQKLVIWSKANQASPSAPASNPMAKAMTRKINYKVRNGDSLARISQRFNVSVSK
ncbi:MAG TPA: LysM peptidoglycan-binding domain-containing protein, partial [Candidatus Tenderia electrophaga]|nr:LysM peptidoglycan-binding domain-containing protein [Candidatus Tenderia electrophaga]